MMLIGCNVVPCWGVAVFKGAVKEVMTGVIKAKVLRLAIEKRCMALEFQAVEQVQLSVQSESVSILEKSE